MSGATTHWKCLACCIFINTSVPRCTSYCDEAEWSNTNAGAGIFIRAFHVWSIDQPDVLAFSTSSRSSVPLAPVPRSLNIRPATSPSSCLCFAFLKNIKLRAFSISWNVKVEGFASKFSPTSCNGRSRLLLSFYTERWELYSSLSIINSCFFRTSCISVSDIF